MRPGEDIYVGGREVLVPDREDVADLCRRCGAPHPDPGEAWCRPCRSNAGHRPVHASRAPFGGGRAFPNQPFR